jgi:predicted DNA-binding transcriptional regulator AlpA
MREELQGALLAARDLPVKDLPEFIGALEEVRVTAMLRLSAPTPASTQNDQLLNAAEAAQRLGMSKDWLYHNHSVFPFTRRVGRRLLFSALGIDKYIRQQIHSDGKTVKR